MTTVSRSIIGIDPGNTGAWCELHYGKVGMLRDMPVIDGFVVPTLLHRDMDQTWSIDLIVVEKVRSMPRQGVASTFKFGAAYGMALGVAAATFPKAQIQQVSPGTWKKHMGLTGKDKDASRLKAIERWPEVAHLFQRKKDHGRAEAALLAEYGRVFVLGEE